jgi:FkbM family methyltransferase
MRRKLKRLLFPTEQQKAMSQWFKIKGDDSLRLDYKLDENSLVMDVGGYQGEWAQSIHDMYKCHIMIFEPVTSFAQNINRRFQNNDRLVCHDFGLGCSTRNETININDDGSSIFICKDKAEQTILIRDVVDFIDENKLIKIDLIKINIEGGEYELLNCLLDNGYIDRFTDIQVQFHDFVDNAKNRMKDIQERLSLTHSRTYHYTFVWENWRKKS